MSFENTAGIGVLNHYGPRVTDQSFGGHQNTVNHVKTAVWQFTYDNLPDGATDNLALSIPANSTIVSAKLRVVTAFAGGTSYAVGLETSADGVIDADGLLTDANLPLASLTPAGKLLTGTGALVGTTIGASAGELTVTATGTFTAGEAQVIVEYITPAP